MQGSDNPKIEMIFKAIGVSPGVVTGPAYVVAPKALSVYDRSVSDSEIPGEIDRFEKALIKTRSQIRKIQAELAGKAGLSDASILDAHLMVLDDRIFIEEVINVVKVGKKNIEFAVNSVAERYAAVFADVQDEYLRERQADVRDVARRLMRNLSGVEETVLSAIKHQHIIVAVDLAPSETATLRKEFVLGFATDLGSPTSHTAVMARALELPAVVGLRDITSKVVSGDNILIDGNKGVFILNPSAASLEEYGKVEEVRRSIHAGLSGLKERPAETKDGRKIVLSANIETSAELGAIRQYGAEGVGLFRSEYLYLSKDRVIGEEEQTKSYVEVASALAPAPVIIRTLDLGGDKYLPGAHLSKEANPFLGCRSIRLSLQYPEHFKMQLRAILKASVFGNVKIMYPMISNVGEVVRANKLLDEAKADLDKEGVPYDHEIEVGVMIEIPAAALTANLLAKEVKFFSIGTNDLVQYTIAVDRVNERVAYLYEPAHPAVLKLIDMTIKAAHDNGIWVGVCGQVAADPLMTPLLLGLGVDELSVAPSAVPIIKDAVRRMTMDAAREVAVAGLKAESADQVLKHCRRVLSDLAPEILELI